MRLGVRFESRLPRSTAGQAEVMAFQPNPTGFFGKAAQRRPMRGPRRDRWMWWRLGTGVAVVVGGVVALLAFTAG
ncbi:hypothetical protein ASF48_01205 [Rathayibacter sp. Leaf299]|nr:hypothetical protein ASF48_01205 [Rathayibacter sp. Leaf299]